jgi:hypothetical protein
MNEDNLLWILKSFIVSAYFDADLKIIVDLLHPLISWSDASRIILPTVPVALLVD